MRRLFVFVLLSICILQAKTADLLVEAESFSNKGGWVVDQQFMDLGILSMMLLR